MDPRIEKEKRNELISILLELAKNQIMLQDKTTLDNMCSRLEALYYFDENEKFRHYYSDIFSTLTIIKDDKTQGDINTVVQNLNYIKDYYIATRDSANDRNITKSINKLCDHVNLDVARLMYSEKGDSESVSEGKIQELNLSISKIIEEISIFEKDQNALKEEQTKQQREYIAILGIFSSVVLAFTGGLTFSTSVLQNIGKASPCLLIVISLIIGLVFINILFGLFYYIDKIVNKYDKSRVKPLVLSNVVFFILLIGIMAYFKVWG